MTRLSLSYTAGTSIVLLALVAASGMASAEEAISDPCSGPSALLAVLDRPTVSDSACVVAKGHAVLEAGFQHANLRGGGTADNYPEAEVRIGLPGSNEFVLLPPNYNQQRTRGFQARETDGFSALTFGLKHE